MKTETLNITIRTNNVLRDAGITTVEELVRLNWDDLNALHGMGGKGAAEVAWACVQVLGGQMAERIAQFDARWPTGSSELVQLYEKAVKFDRIRKIVGG